jgi:lipoprotein-anchoring transpeptidase ErfK/SrfK
MKRLAMVAVLLFCFWLGWGVRPSYAEESGDATPPIHTVQAGESISQIALRYQLTPLRLAESNQLSLAHPIFPGQRLTLPPEAVLPVDTTGTVHEVQWGETLNEIALQYGISATTLLSLNGIENPDLIYAGQRLRLVAQNEATTAPIATFTPAPPSKHIIVDLSEQRAYAYENGELWRTFVVSTGQAGLETATGSFTIQNKFPVAHAYTWGLEMPYWMGIYWAGHLQNGFHALPVRADGSVLWDGYLGTPVSYGCIILSTADAAALYQWAQVGTPVTIQP